MSYGRMKKEEAHLRAEIETMLQRAEAADREEDERYGEGSDATDLPEELQRRDVRLRRIQEDKAELEKEAAEARAEKLRELAKEQEKKADDPSVDPAERSELPPALSRAKSTLKHWSSGPMTMTSHRHPRAQVNFLGTERAQTPAVAPRRKRSVTSPIQTVGS